MGRAGWWRCRVVMRGGGEKDSQAPKLTVQREGFLRVPGI